MGIFEYLKYLSKENGIECIVRENGHVTLNGKLQVNYWPISKKRSAYISGTVKAHTGVTPEDAILLCSTLPEAQGVKNSRRKNYRKLKKKLIKRMTNCHWCKTPLVVDTATIEHIIPLSRGGLDHQNNMTLACKPCNNDRGSDMPELLDLEK